LNNKKKPVILILSGPSGAGKTTLSHALIASIPDTIIAKSHTTRSPRPGEKDGEDYYFVSQKEFQQLVQDGEMLEYAEVYGHLYGTSRNTLLQAINKGKNIILDIDWQGARRIKKVYPEAISVYILPPAERESKARLISRQQDSPETIQSRMSTYREQLSHQSEYDYVIVNDNLAEATLELRKILASS